MKPCRVALVAAMAVAAFTPKSGIAHERVDDCIELVADAGRWHLVNRCDYALEMDWCLIEGNICVWKGKQSLSTAGDAGDSYSTGYPSGDAVRGHVVACRNDPPDYGGMWGSVVQGSGRYWCLDPHFEETDILTSGTAPDDNHCVEFGPRYEARYGHRNQLHGTFQNMRNVCGYSVEVVRCYIPPNDQWLRSALCGEVGRRYYPLGFDLHLEAGGESGDRALHADPMRWAACRHGFDPNGWDGNGGFRCLDGEL